MNGDVGTITAISADGVTLRIDGRDVMLGRGFVAAGGRLTHGYALTTHRTQGGTWDASIAVGLDGLYREGAYTALSRGREQNVLIMTDPEMTRIQTELDPDLKRHDRGLALPDESAPSAVDDLLAHLAQRRGKDLAHSLDPDVARIDQLAHTVAYPELVQRVAISRRNERFATERVGDTLANLVSRHERFEHTATHIVAGSTVKAVDRSNIGTVTDVDDSNGSAIVRFRSVGGQTANATFDWSDLEVMKPVGRRELSPSVSSLVESRRDHSDHAVELWNSTLEAMGSTPTSVADSERAASQQLEAATRALEAGRPAWLTDRLGDRPSDPVGAVTWDGTVRDIARHRLEQSLPIGVPLLGDRPDSVATQGWDRLTTQVSQTRSWLDERPAPRLELGVPSTDQLRARLSNVVDILATAPTDQRSTIEQLLAGQQPFDGMPPPLDSPLVDSERADWIAENWPHIVEHAEIETALAGPNQDLLAALDEARPERADSPSIEL